MVSRSRGTTLIELCLVFAMVGVIMTLVSLYFVRARHYASDTETYSTVQRQANLALRRLTDAFYKGSKEWDQYYGDSVIFLSSEALTPSEPDLEFDAMTGEIVWKKWVCFYHDPVSQQIIRAEQPLALPTSNLLTQPEPEVSPEYFRTESALTRRTVARDVKNFQVVGTGTSYEVTVTCEAFSPVPGKSEEEKRVEVTVTTEIFLLN